MKTLLALEELAHFGLSLLLFSALDYGWAGFARPVAHSRLRLEARRRVPEYALGANWEVGSRES